MFLCKITLSDSDFMTCLRISLKIFVYLIYNAIIKGFTGNFII